MIPMEVSGSRLPVGSSASSSGGWFTNARAIETRCCSPPDSSSGKLCSFVERPTRRRMSGTLRRISWRDSRPWHVRQQMAGDRDLAPAWLELLHHQADAGGLAAAGGAHEEDELAAT